jgi:site-specific DNA-methyltransferase (adenine-specific)
MRDSIVCGSCLSLLPSVSSGAIDALITDPPYGLGTKLPNPEQVENYLSGGTLNHGGDFMGKDWEMPSVHVWRQAHRVLKPDGLLGVFAGTRTVDLMAAGVLASGFKLVRRGAWIYSSGFPKSMSVGKAIDRSKGATREVVGVKSDPRYKSPRKTAVFGKRVWEGSSYATIGTSGTGSGEDHPAAQITAPATAEAEAWEGWGTALKPAWEPFLIFAKESSDKGYDPSPLFMYCAKPPKKETTAGGTIENKHLTVKPLRLMRYFIEAMTAPGDLVLDPYVGSGTTAVACVETGRSYLGFEKDPASHTTAVQRVEEAIQRTAPDFDLMTLIAQARGE